MLAARQDEETVTPPLVGENLQIRQEFRNALDLIQDGPFTEAGEKAPRIGLRELPLIGRLQIDVSQIREGLATDGGLARLTRSGHGHEGVLPEEAGQAGHDVAFDRERRLSCHEIIALCTFRLFKQLNDDDIFDNEPSDVPWQLIPKEIPRAVESDRPLVRALRSQDFSVWFDECENTPRDTGRETP